MTDEWLKTKIEKVKSFDGFKQEYVNDWECDSSTGRVIDYGGVSEPLQEFPKGSVEITTGGRGMMPNIIVVNDYGYFQDDVDSVQTTKVRGEFTNAKGEPLEINEKGYMVAKDKQQSIKLGSKDKSPISVPYKVEPVEKKPAGPILALIGVLIKQIGERLGEDGFNNLFSEDEYRMLLSHDLDDTVRLALFNNRIVSIFLDYSGKEDKHVLNYIAELNPGVGLHEYSINFTKSIIPFIKEFNLLKVKAY